MKRKTIIILIVVSIIFILSIIANYIDSARVRNGIEPKLTLKLVSKNGNKVTYLGLGYKVIRYPSISPNEPYKNNRGVKFGNWFMNYQLEEENNNLEIKRIIDKTETENDLMCAQVIYKFYEDKDYEYYYSCAKTTYVVVEYKNNTEETVENALKNNHIKISDLDNYNIKYNKSKK